MVDRRTVRYRREKPKFGESVNEWFTLLTSKFKKPFTITIDVYVAREIYNEKCSNKRKPRKFVQEVIVLAKNAGFI